MHRTEHLHRALFRQLNQPFQQLFLLQWIAQTNTTEQFWREVRNTGELHVLTLREGVANLNRAVVVQTNDIAGIGFLNV